MKMKFDKKKFESLREYAQSYFVGRPRNLSTAWGMVHSYMSDNRLAIDWLYEGDIYDNHVETALNRIINTLPKE